ncbi:MAG: NAD(P)-dependent oxidoreductase [Bryobacteraceae bacterium]
MRVGLIGAGLLGTAIVERLVIAGFEVSAFDTDPARLEVVSRVGARPLGSAVEAAAGPFVVLCLPDASVSAAVADEIAASVGDAAVIDTTTGDPTEIAEIGRRLPRYVDATIAGSSEQVRGRDAVVMAGGDPADIAAAAGLFEAIAARVFHVGPRGAGARMKLVVNLVLGLNRAVLAEGLAFAEATGVDPVAALEVLRAGPAYSAAMDRKGKKMLERDWTPEARLRQHHKDVRLILAEAARGGIELTLSGVHERLLAEAAAAGFGDADNSAILEVMRGRGGG